MGSILAKSTKSGAKAISYGALNVAAEAATHKALKES